MPVLWHHSHRGNFLTSPGPTGHLLTVKRNKSLPVMPKQMFKTINLSSIFQKSQLKLLQKLQPLSYLWIIKLLQAACGSFAYGVLRHKVLLTRTCKYYKVSMNMYFEYKSENFHYICNPLFSFPIIYSAILLKKQSFIKAHTNAHFLSLRSDTRKYW